jgi:hypothetical protein
MNFIVSKVPIGPTPRRFARLLLAVIAIGYGTTWSCVESRAGFIIDYDKIKTEQSVNFTPANNGTTVVGDTNPAPVYNVFADLLSAPGAGTILHGSGSVVDTGSGGLGFYTIAIRPETGYAWTAIEFMLNSMQNLAKDTSERLTITAYNGAYSESKSLNFPWEGNNGQNQHYHVLATGSDVITKVVISYDPPDPLPGETVNAIGDIHNIDVTTVPEPTSLAIFGVGAFAIAGYCLRRSRLLAKEA